MQRGLGRVSQFASLALRPDGELYQLEFPQAVRFTVHVDSRDRNYAVHPSSSSFTVDLPETLKNVSSAALVSAELPLSYYVFSASRHNTSLAVTLDGATHLVTIPDGNYTASTMASALKTALDTAFSASFTVAIDPASMRCTISIGAGALSIDTFRATTARLTLSLGGVEKTVVAPASATYTSVSLAAALKTALETAYSPVTFTVAISPSTGAITVTPSAGSAAVVSFATDSPATAWDLGYYLGLRNGDAATALATNSVTGSAVASLNPENYVMIDIEELGRINQSAMYAAGGSGLKSFAKVPLNNGLYQYHCYERMPLAMDVRPHLAKLDKITVAARFHDGSLVDFNGGEWSMSLEFACTLARGAL